MRSWVRKHVRRDKYGRSAQNDQLKWAGDEAGVTEDSIPSISGSISTDIYPEPGREIFALSSTILPTLSNVELESARGHEPRKNFWQDAFQVLLKDKDNRKLLDIYQKTLREESGISQSNSEEAPDYLLRIIGRNLQLIDEQHWKARLGNTSVELRKLLNSIAETAQYAQSFVGTVVSGEPHAAMAWAGVSLFLPLLLNASEQPKSLIEGIDYISRILCQFAVIERLYQEHIDSVPLAAIAQDTGKLRFKFEEDLTMFYAQVLQYQCRAICQLQSNKATRVARDMVKLDNWEGMLSKLKECEIACDKSRVVLDSAKLQREFQNLDDTIKRLQDMTSTSVSLQRQANETFDQVQNGQDPQTEQLKTERDNRCIQNFYVSAYEKQMKRHPDAVKGTCHWLLDNPNFQNWKDTEYSSLLWVSAGPGCGKSVGSKMLIKMLSESGNLPGNPRTVCYFFFKEDDDSQRMIESALYAVLHQILTTPGNSKLMRHATSSYDASGVNIRYSFARMWEILMKIVQDPSAGEIICILDALDECEDKEGTGRYVLIDALQKFHSDFIETTNPTTACLKVLVTSRPYTDIERRFKALTRKFPTVRLSGDEESAKISKEIDLVIEEEVKRLRTELDLDDTTTFALRKKVLDMKHRTYLWLRLIFEVLRQQLKTTERHLLHVIEELPQTVDQAYEAILNRIPKCELGRARKILKIVLAAERPLHVQEMNIALAVEENPTQNSLSSLDIESEPNLRATLRNICGLFVTVVDSKVYLIHQTARSFLLSNHET